MTLRKHDLGYASATGKAAVDQALRFKDAMHRKIGRGPDGAYLMTVEDREARTRGYCVWCDDEQPNAVAWADRARDAAADVWRAVEQQGKERQRG